MFPGSSNSDMRSLSVLLLLLLCPALIIAAEKEFGSIGAQVVPTASGEVVVLQVVNNAPADRAGLQPGDLIVRIDGVPLKGLDFKTVTRQHLWGFIGEPVLVVWLRPGEAGERKSELIRVKLDPELLRHPDVKMVKPGK